MFHCFIAYVIFIFDFIIITILFFLHFPLSGPVLTYISLLIIPCMIVYVTNNKEPWTLILKSSLLWNNFKLFCQIIIRFSLQFVSQSQILDSWTLQKIALCLRHGFK